MPFVGIQWFVNDTARSRALEVAALFCSRWRLPLLLFISGVAVFCSLQRRSWRQFTRERLHRLLLPLIFGMFVVIPPQIYYERLHKGVINGSFADFYPEVLRLVPYPLGAFGWLHLWFLAYVLVFSLAALPILLWLRNESGRCATAALARCFESCRPAVYSVVLPVALTAIVLSPRWPITYNLTSDWANLSSSFFIFLLGFVFASERRLLDLLTRRRQEFLCFSLLMVVLFFATGRAVLGTGWAATSSDAWTGLISSCLSIGWIFALTGYARAVLDRSSRWLPRATEAVYPFYIVHQTITVAAAYYVVRWPLGVWTKFAIITAATFLGCWAVYELVRRIGFLRPLFGLKTVARRALPAASVTRGLVRALRGLKLRPLSPSERRDPTYSPAQPRPAEFQPRRRGSASE